MVLETPPATLRSFWVSQKLLKAAWTFESGTSASLRGGAINREATYNFIGVVNPILVKSRESFC